MSVNLEGALSHLRTLSEAERDRVAQEYPNPPCWEHCDNDHEPDEFAVNEGEIWCNKLFGEGESGWRVVVERYQVTLEPFDYLEPDASLRQPVRAYRPQLVVYGLGPDGLDAGEAADLAVVLAASAAFMHDLPAAD